MICMTVSDGESSLGSPTVNSVNNPLYVTLYLGQACNNDRINLAHRPCDHKRHYLLLPLTLPSSTIPRIRLFRHASRGIYIQRETIIPITTARFSMACCRWMAAHEKSSSPSICCSSGLLGFCIEARYRLTTSLSASSTF